MSIIKKPPATMTREFHLQEPASQTLDNYARFIGSTPDRVIASALGFLLWKGLDFKRWQKEQRETSQPTQSTELKILHIFANPIR